MVSVDGGNKSRIVLWGAWGLLPLLVLCEIFFAARESYSWLHVNVADGIFRNVHIAFLLEWMMRAAWLVLMVLFFRQVHRGLLPKSKRMLIFTIVIAAILLCLSLAFLASWLIGLKFSSMTMLLFLKMHSTFLLLWSISILFILASPDLKRIWAGKTWLFAMALGGGFICVMNKGTVWLQLIVGPYPLKGDFIHGFFALLPMLILLGHLAQIFLFTFVPENGGTEEGR